MERGRVADWLVPSIGDVMFLSIFFWTLSQGGGLLNDGDTGWHIVTGDNIIRTLSIPYADPYSYSMPGIPWTAHEWLAEIIFAMFHRLMGLRGVVVFSAALISSTFYCLYRFLLRRSVSPVTAALFTVVAASASTLHWLARPHIFSMPLTLATIVILELYQREGKNYLKFLPVLMIFWVNLHAGFILGLILILLYAGGNLVLSIAVPDGRDESRKRFRAIGLIAAATVAATFVNPHGPAILYFPFHLVGREYIMNNVLEWLSPNFHESRDFEVMLFLFILVFVLSRKKPDVFEGGAALLLTHMSLYSARYIPLMALIVTPMAAVRAGDALERLVGCAPGIGVLRRIGGRLKKISMHITPLEQRFNRRLWPTAAVIACLAVALNGGRAAGSPVMDYSQDKRIFPVDALDFAMKNNITGRMFNNDGWGGYIIYRSYPHYKVFFDGRSDMYGVPFMKQYVKVARVGLGCEDVLDRYGVTWVIYNANSPLGQFLVAGGKWHLVYADTTANIFLKDVPGNQRLIRKYRYARFVPNDEQD